MSLRTIEILRTLDTEYTKFDIVSLTSSYEVDADDRVYLDGTRRRFVNYFWRKFSVGFPYLDSDQMSFLYSLTVQGDFKVILEGRKSDVIVAVLDDIDVKFQGSEIEFIETKPTATW